MAWLFAEKHKLVRALLLGTLAMVAVTGCHKKQQTDTGKTYTADQKSGQDSSGNKSQSGGGSNSGGGSSSGGSSSSSSSDNTNAPLNSPANTTDYKASPASDAGTSQAVQGAVVAEPGAPAAPAGGTTPSNQNKPPQKSSAAKSGAHSQ
jgi:hypothetical protein